VSLGEQGAEFCGGCNEDMRRVGSECWNDESETSAGPVQTASCHISNEFNSVSFNWTEEVGSSKQRKSERGRYPVCKWYSSLHRMARQLPFLYIHEQRTETVILKIIRPHELKRPGVFDMYHHGQSSTSGDFSWFPLPESLYSETFLTRNSNITETGVSRKPVTVPSTRSPENQNFKDLCFKKPG
jgi:hypothetical protein